MRRTSITDAKNNLSALIAQVRKGETVLICDRNRPVVRMLPVGSGDVSVADTSWMAGLVREGLLEPARTPLTARTLPKPVKPSHPTSIIAALQADREE